uniref:Uncharacterized protein n=1 Tax=Timema shepardi TaxID=629360 RepID=A0A7R9FZX4_TIMSH|nr:unnamed protein product [Timema shepardi]
MVSLVLSDSSQLTALKRYQTKLCIPTPNHMICKNMCLSAVTSDSQNLGVYLNVDCQKVPYTVSSPVPWAPSHGTIPGQLSGSVKPCQHFAHLYGPMILIEDKKGEVLRTMDELMIEAQTVPSRTQSLKAGQRHQSRLPKVDFRRRTFSAHHERQEPDPEDLEIVASTETLRQAFRNNPYQKYHERYNPNLIDDDNQELSNQLEMRHRRSLRITHVAASSLADPAVSPDLGDRRVHSELEARYSDDLGGLYAIMERTQKRLSRQFSSCGSVSVGEESRLSLPASPNWSTASGVVDMQRRQSQGHREQTQLQDIAESDDVFVASRRSKLASIESMV